MDELLAPRPGFGHSGRLSAWLVLSALALLLGGCSTVELGPVPQAPPLFRRINARIGVVYTAAARNARISEALVRMEVGEPSIARLEKAFAAMFTQVVDLPDWPPWRNAAPAVDGVVEVERIEPHLRMGNDAGGTIFQGLAQRDMVTISYRICLYTAAAMPIECWTPTVAQSHQRGVGECLDVRPCVARMTEAAIREAIALFMVEAERTSVLRAWSAQLPPAGSKQ